ncbi:MAG: DnaD domain protein [Clostridia bacterium]|nr:DnaD domain protein [Clostridia bacterium]
MPFCTYSQDMNDTNFTVVDNWFITQYMPDAPIHCVEVYLFGLALCKEHPSTNTVEVMSRVLGISRDDILSAYYYWEELGLVNIFNNAELEIVYLPIRQNQNILKKIKSSKYNSFCKQMQNTFKHRMLTPNELNEYFLFLETTFFQPEALVHVAQYCLDLKGQDISYQYILTVARSLSSGGIKTLEAVQDKLNEHPKYNQDLMLIFKALRVKRKIEYYDRDMYDRWTKEFTFNLDTIIKIASTCKVGGMTRLNSLLEDYYRKNLLSIKEIDAYAEQKQELLTIAKDINKAMGIYYQNVDPIIEEYITPWLNKGYDCPTLLKIAKYCFKNNIRTLSGMATVVDKFYKRGLTSIEAINQYIEQVLYSDSSIKHILDQLGIVRSVSSYDRQCYKTWTTDWKTDSKLLEYATTLAQNTTNPMAYLNKVLSNYHSNGINSVDMARNTTVATDILPRRKQRDYSEREYSDQELRALFDNLEDVEV